MERAAGQRLMVGFEGLYLDDGLKWLIENLHVGGIILFARNIDTPEQVRTLCADARQCAAEHGLPPLFIAVDQEGGPVARLKAPHFTEFPGNRAIRTVEGARDVAQAMNVQLVDLGFNMNMAPVLDVAPEDMESIDSIMADRVFPGGPEHVGLLGEAVIRTFQENGVMAVAKHFPGIGRTQLDSHHDLPVFDAPLSDIRDFELIPFAVAIKAKVAGIMFSHILYPELDPDLPASLSPAIAGELLRRQMGYDGLTLTDDMDMGAVAKHYELGPSVSRILDAEVDITLLCRDPGNIEVAFETIVRQLTDDPRHRALNDASQRRIERAKRLYIKSNA